MSIRSMDTTLHKSPQVTSPTTASGHSSFLSGHGPVHTDEHHAAIIPRATGENMYSLLQLPGGIRRERVSDIQKRGCEAS